MLYVVVTGCMFRLGAGLEECVCYDFDVLPKIFFAGSQLDGVYVRIVYFLHKLSSVGVNQSTFCPHYAGALS